MLAARPTAARPSSSRVFVLALDGVLDASLGAAVDVLRAADRVAAALGRSVRLEGRVVSARKAVRLGSGMSLRTEGSLEELSAADIVLVPGVNSLDAADLDALLGAPGARRAAQELVRAHRRGALLAASCSAVFLLAEHGLLAGARVTTMWALGPLFRRRYPELELDLDATTICAGMVWTAGAALSIVDLALAIVRRFAGADIAETCVRYLALDTRPTQARYFVLDHLARTSPELARAEAWARANLGRGFSIAELSRAIGTSPRTLARRVHEALGTTPIRFVQRLRAEKAQHLLATTAMRLDEVAERVGYHDPSALRRVLRREARTSARGIRGESRHRKRSATARGKRATTITALAVDRTRLSRADPER